MTETTPLSGKKTWSSELSASTRICSRRQGTCSRYDISLLRSREGNASNSRLRGNLDKKFMLSQNPGSAPVPERVVSLRRELTAEPSGSGQNQQIHDCRTPDLPPLLHFRHRSLTSETPATGACSDSLDRAHEAAPSSGSTARGTANH